MDKLISLIVASVIFYVIEFILVPLLPSPAQSFVSLIVIVIAIVYLLGSLTGYTFPWRKP
jgi:FtsH-binding integral membrane protein